MRKTYEVTCELNLDASHIEKIRVVSNLPQKAIKLAEEKLKKAGNFHVSVIGYKEV